MKFGTKIISPCCDCEDRVPPTRDTYGCKESCIRLKEYEKAKQQEYEERDRKRKEKDVILEYRHESRERTEKLKKGHRPLKRCKRNRRNGE